MPQLKWDEPGKRTYETGIENGVLYLAADDGSYPEGIAWNGLTGVEENPSGAESNKIYADNMNYLTLLSAEDFGCTIKAYTYPDAFEACNGEAELITGAVIGQQSRATFGLVYKTKIGNDVKGDAYGYKLHLIYGCKVSPSQKSYNTINDSPEAIEFSWEASCTPVNVTGYKATCTLVIDSTKFPDETSGEKNAKLAALEAQLFGQDGGTGTTGITANLPLPDEVLDILD